MTVFCKKKDNEVITLLELFAIFVKKKMTANIINIGNSKGLILPITILKRLRMTAKTAVEIEVTDDYILIKKVQHREGWAASAKKQHLAGDDQLLIEELPTDFENTEWTW
jgi:antitoxin component of MazEF toxin-antitoxin module